VIKVKNTTVYFLILLLLIQVLPFRQELAYATDSLDANTQQEAESVFFNEAGNNDQNITDENITDENSQIVKEDSENGTDQSSTQNKNTNNMTESSNSSSDNQITEEDSSEQIQNEEPQETDSTSELQPTQEDKNRSINEVEEPSTTDGSTSSNPTVLKLSLDDIVTLKGVGVGNPTRIFSGPSTDAEVIKTYAQGSILKYQSYNSDWFVCTVSVNGREQTGYIHVNDVENVVANPIPYSGVALKSPTRIYEKASTNSDSIKTYAQGSILNYQSFANGWYKASVYVNGKARTGFIHANDVENVVANSIPYSGVALKSPTRIYERASTNSNSIKTYAQGSVLNYQSFANGWYKASVYVDGKTRTGFIHANDVENVVTNSIPYTGVALKSPTRIYEKASTNSNSIKTYAQGSVLNYQSFANGWYKASVYVNGKTRTGYIHANDVENVVADPIPYSGVALKSPTRIYEKASTNSNSIKTYSYGSILNYQSFANGWYKATVYVNGKARTGYIHANDVENVVADSIHYSGVALKSPTRIYERASTNSKSIKSYTHGSILNYQSFANGWYKASVYVNGKARTGYISANDVENVVDSPSKISVWGIVNKINVYTNPSKNASILKSYNKDSELKVETFSSSWYKATVYINGSPKTGYISKDDVSTEKISYLELDLRKPANITAKDIENFFDLKNRGNSPLKKYAQSYIDAQTKYGVNAVYLVAHAIWETGWGGSNLITYKNNLYGYGAYDVCPFTCGYYFDSVEDSINAVAYMVKDNYLTPNGAYYYGPNLTGMNVSYATDQNWKNGIASLMEGIQSYDPKYYSNKSAIVENGRAPENLSREIPAGKLNPSSIIIDFPVGITAIVNQNANYRSLPYVNNGPSSNLLGSLRQSTKVTVLGYNTDVRTSGSYPYDHRWFRISVNNQVAWVYGKYLTIGNLLQVTGVSSRLNIRETPVDGNTLISVPSNSFLKGVIKDGQLVSNNGWYNVYLPDSNTTGWVSGEYISKIEN